MRALWPLLLFALAALWPGAAIHGAEPAGPEGDLRLAPSCHATSGSRENLVALLAGHTAWNCDDIETDITPSRVLLSWDIGPGREDAAAPTHFVTRRAEMGRLQVTGIAGGKVLPVSTYHLDDFSYAGIEGLSAIPLPENVRAAQRIVIAIDQPTSPAQIGKAALVSGDPALTTTVRRGTVLVGLIIGMLLMPFIFNLAFYRALKEPFLVWHCVSAAGMIAHLFFASGFASAMAGISTSVVSFGATATFGLMIAGATMFAHSFIEPGKLHPVLRRLLVPAAITAAVLSLLHAVFPLVWRPIQLQLYIAAFAPVVVILLLTMGDALRRKSRAAIYQAAGWGPLIAMGLVRQVSYLAPFVPPTDAMALFYMGCAFEVLATALGVADRLVLLRRQRDDARREARDMQDLSTRDALTGMLNRRAIEPRFTQLREDGFVAVAVIDIDHFKRINDRHGHQVGDEVLQACAGCLSNDDDRDVIALRLGGEEFMLLLRGPNSFERAEAMRQALTVRIARDVEALGWPVTASMGLVELPMSGFAQTSFADFYARADRLLYDAKAGGRNRTMSERLSVFEARPAVQGETVRAA